MEKKNDLDIAYKVDKSRVVCARISAKDYEVLKKNICISTTIRQHLEKVARALNKKDKKND
jgi:hypothetical protein